MPWLFLAMSSENKQFRCELANYVVLCTCTNSEGG
nr:MAG TPA: Ribosomal silencing factor during starvation [Caudoviricetes sp.]